jgi:hypothetical protein
MLIKLRKLLVSIAMMLIAVQMTSSAPKTWPYMKNYDIWETNKTTDSYKERLTLVVDFEHDNLLGGQKNRSSPRVNARKAKGESAFE